MFHIYVPLLESFDSLKAEAKVQIQGDTKNVALAGAFTTAIFSHNPLNTVNASRTVSRRQEKRIFASDQMATESRHSSAES